MNKKEFFFFLYDNSNDDSYIIKSRSDRYHINGNNQEMVNYNKNNDNCANNINHDNDNNKTNNELKHSDNAYLRQGSKVTDVIKIFTLFPIKITDAMKIFTLVELIIKNTYSLSTLLKFIHCLLCGGNKGNGDNDGTHSQPNRGN